MLELKEKILSIDHLLTLASINNLVVVLNSQGKYKEAEKLQRKTLGLVEKALSVDYLDILAIMNNLVEVLYY